MRSRKKVAPVRAAIRSRRPARRRMALDPNRTSGIIAPSAPAPPPGLFGGAPGGLPMAGRPGIGGPVPGFKKGGKVKKTGMARVHKGERVLTAKQANAMKKPR